VGDKIVNVANITHVDYRDIEELRVVVSHRGGMDMATGTQAIEIVMALNPAAFEGKRLQWLRHAWALHNFVGHPVMQLLSFMGAYRLALRVHDRTVPRPLGVKSRKRS